MQYLVFSFLGAVGALMAVWVWLVFESLKNRCGKKDLWFKMKAISIIIYNLFQCAYIHWRELQLKESPVWNTNVVEQSDAWAEEKY